MTSPRCTSIPPYLLSPQPRFRESVLDERQDLGPEFLHTREDFVGCRTAESEIDAADTNVAQRPDVGGDDCRRTGEQAVFAVTSQRWRGLAEHRAAQSQADRLGIATRLTGQLAQARNLGLETHQAIERILRVGTDRIPGIADPGSSSQRRTALASDPDRRMRLLHRLRL